MGRTCTAYPPNPRRVRGNILDGPLEILDAVVYPRACGGTANRQPAPGAGRLPRAQLAGCPLRFDRYTGETGADDCESYPPAAPTHPAHELRGARISVPSRRLVDDVFDWDIGSQQLARARRDLDPRLVAGRPGSSAEADACDRWEGPRLDRLDTTGHTGPPPGLAQMCAQEPGLPVHLALHLDQQVLRRRVHALALADRLAEHRGVVGEALLPGPPRSCARRPRRPGTPPARWPRRPDARCPAARRRARGCARHTRRRSRASGPPACRTARAGR